MKMMEWPCPLEKNTISQILIAKHYKVLKKTKRILPQQTTSSPLFVHAKSLLFAGEQKKVFQTIQPVYSPSQLLHTLTAALWFPPAQKSLTQRTALQCVHLVTASHPEYTAETSDSQEFSDSCFLKSNLSKSFHRESINFDRVEKKKKTS